MRRQLNDLSKTEQLALTDYVRSRNPTFRTASKELAQAIEEVANSPESTKIVKAWQQQFNAV